MLRQLLLEIGSSFVAPYDKVTRLYDNRAYCIVRSLTADHPPLQSDYWPEQPKHTTPSPPVEPTASHSGPLFLPIVALLFVLSR